MILIVSNTQDLTSDFIVREISRRRLSFARLNTDEFPVKGYGLASFGFAGRSRKAIRWKNRSKNLDFDRVSSVLYRRPVPPFPDESVSEPEIRKFCIDESYDFLRGIWFSLDCYWMSHPEAIRKAEHKVYQLGVAATLPFRIPKTIITNDPQEVSEFFYQCSTGIIIKPLYLGFIDKPNAPQYIFTSVVSESDLVEIENVQIAPSIYQERIVKDFDVRVTVVGERIFPVKIIAGSLPPNIPDWRSMSGDELQYEEYSLPREIEDACLQIVKRLDLDFGAIDLAVDKQGNHVFFEINPNGQWAWLETLLDLPISKAIVDRLSVFSNELE